MRKYFGIFFLKDGERIEKVSYESSPVQGPRSQLTFVGWQTLPSRSPERIEKEGYKAHPFRRQRYKKTLQLEGLRIGLNLDLESKFFFENKRYQRIAVEISEFQRFLPNGKSQHHQSRLKSVKGSG
jgi:hypothetical protein